MAITYKRVVNRLNRETIGNQQDVVVSVSWDYVGEDLETGFKASFPVLTTVPFNEDGDFVNYSNLTLEVVDGWISQHTPDNKLVELEMLVGTAYTNLNGKVSNSTLPWNE